MTFLPVREHQYQAQQFVDYFCRAFRGISIRSAFARWTDTKDFSPRDSVSIWCLVEGEMISGHRNDSEEITVTDRETLLESYCENPSCQVRNFHFYLKPYNRPEIIQAKKLFCPVCGLQTSHWVKPSVFDEPPSSLIASGSEGRRVYE